MVEIAEAHPGHKPGRQLELFSSPASPPSAVPSPASPAPPIDPLIGLAVKLPDKCRCSGALAVIGAGTDLHRATLRCRSCGEPRGFLSKPEAAFIERIAATFGAPPVITLRGLRP